MKQFSDKNSYRRNLPHFQPEGATIFITFRLANSIPKDIVERFRAEKELEEKGISWILDKSEREKQLRLEHRRFFGLWDDALDLLACDEKHLSNSQIAELVTQSLLYRNGKVYDLETFCLMPNHVHLVCIPLEESGGIYFPLSKIMHSLKRYTARKSNQILKREGTLWQHENYDHYVRDAAELERIIEYALYNPVKAGLVDDWA